MSETLPPTEHDQLDDGEQIAAAWRELLAASADMLRFGDHENCTALPGRGCHDHIRAFDARANRLRLALHAARVHSGIWK